MIASPKIEFIIESDLQPKVELPKATPEQDAELDKEQMRLVGKYVKYRLKVGKNSDVTGSNLVTSVERCIVCEEPCIVARYEDGGFDSTHLLVPING